MANFRTKKLIYLLTVSLVFLYSCGSPSKPEEEQAEQIPDSDEVPADATLEAVTWNLEWYGDDSNGPADEQQQTKNIIKVTDSLKADLYAFQEVYDQQALNEIIGNMKGYRGFVADHIEWIQKTAFVYNTNTIDSLAAGAITQGQNEDAWAGRLPLYFRFTYSFEGNSLDFYAIVIHAKAFSDKESYERRKAAAQNLYDYLMADKPDANIILLGDYNDDVDESTYNSEETPYRPFVTNSSNFQVVTKTLSESGESSTVHYSNMIDHITMSNELYPIFVDESASVFQFGSSFISNYDETTTDHYPVWAKFDVTKSGNPGRIAP